jgi:hypothetical protein
VAKKPAPKKAAKPRSPAKQAEEKERTVKFIGDPVTIRMGSEDHDIEHHYESFELDGVLYTIGMFVALRSDDAGASKCVNRKRPGKAAKGKSSLAHASHEFVELKCTHWNLGTTCARPWIQNGDSSWNLYGCEHDWVGQLVRAWKREDGEGSVEIRWFDSERDIPKKVWKRCRTAPDASGKKKDGGSSSNDLQQYMEMERFENDICDEQPIESLEGPVDMVTDPKEYIRLVEERQKEVRVILNNYDEVEAFKFWELESSWKPLFWCNTYYDRRSSILRPCTGNKQQLSLRSFLFSDRRCMLPIPKEFESDSSSWSNYDDFNSGDDESLNSDDDDDDDGTEGGAKGKQSAAGGKKKKSATPGDINRATSALQLSSIPLSLPCRSKERSQVYNFLHGWMMRGGFGSSLYISGMPGTGKTATVLEVIRDLTAKQRAGELPYFEFIEINAMKIKAPEDAYSILCREVLGHQCGYREAAQALDKHFCRGTPPDSTSPYTIVLVDELDHMLTPKQTVLYNLFDWPTKANARLAIIGIANTMDLPERLTKRVASRLGTQRLMYHSYTHKEITEILLSRLVCHQGRDEGQGGEEGRGEREGEWGIVYTP